jgi:hypothetical protein
MRWIGGPSPSEVAIFILATPAVESDCRAPAQQRPIDRPSRTCLDRTPHRLKIGKNHPLCAGETGKE